MLGVVIWDLMHGLRFTEHGLRSRLVAPRNTLWRRVHDGWLGMHVQQGGGPCCWSVHGRDSRGGHEAVSMVRRCHVSGSEVRVDVNLLGFRGRW